LPPGATNSLVSAFTTSTDALQDTPSIVGQRVSPDIYTTTGPVHDAAEWSDVQKISYFLTLPTNSPAGDVGGKDLVRQITRNLLTVNYEQPEQQWLMSGVIDFRLQYFDGLSWIDTWDSNTNTNLPNAVRVQMTLMQDQVGSRTPLPVELVVPIFAQGQTNSTASTSSGGGGQ
jgi:hypothetical protein